MSFGLDLRKPVGALTFLSEGRIILIRSQGETLGGLSVAPDFVGNLACCVGTERDSIKVSYLFLCQDPGNILQATLRPIYFLAKCALMNSIDLNTSDTNSPNDLKVVSNERCSIVQFGTVLSYLLPIVNKS